MFEKGEIMSKKIKIEIYDLMPKVEEQQEQKEEISAETSTLRLFVIMIWILNFAIIFSFQGLWRLLSLIPEGVIIYLLGWEGWLK